MRVQAISGQPNSAIQGPGSDRRTFQLREVRLTTRGGRRCLQAMPSLRSRVSDDSGILDAFCGLAETPGGEKAAAAARRFVQRYGSLDLCEHEEPPGVHPACRPAGFQPVEAYVGLAMQMKSMRSWIAEARSNRTARVTGRGLMRNDAVLFLKCWAIRGDVGLGFSWRPEDPAPRVGLVSRGAAGALARQLMIEVLQGSTVRLCRGCSEAFAPARAQQRYCRACIAHRVPQRLALEAHRSRSKGGLTR